MEADPGIATLQRLSASVLPGRPLRVATWPYDLN
jgi:hypothetical protein